MTATKRRQAAAKDGEPLSRARQFPQHGAMPERGVINMSNVICALTPSGFRPRE